jgi:hypothetical protein
MNDEPNRNHFTALSRSVCASNARSAHIFEQYRKVYDLSQIFMTGLQHAGTAATALMAEIMIEDDEDKRADLLSSLSSLEVTIGMMSRAYQPALLMGKVLDHFIRGCTEKTNRDDRLHSETPNNKRRRQAETPDEANKRPRSSNPFDVTTSGTTSNSPQGLPFLPSSWLEDLSADDAAFLNLVGLNQINHSAAMGLLSASSYPWATEMNHA